MRTVLLTAAHPTLTPMKTEHVTLPIEGPPRFQNKRIEAALDVVRRRWVDLLARLGDATCVCGVGAAPVLDNPFRRLGHFAKEPVENQVNCL